MTPSPTPTPSPTQTPTQTPTPTPSLVPIPVITNNTATANINATVAMAAIAALPNGGTLELPVVTSAGTTNVVIPMSVVNAANAGNVTFAVTVQGVTYSLPASLVATAIPEGSTAEIRIRVASPTATEQTQFASSAQTMGAKFVVAPMSFHVEVTIITNGQASVVPMNSFNTFVERQFEIPAGVNPSQITTGIVFNTDGTFRHVPTKVIKVGDKYFAKLNSLTNSFYSVIYKPTMVKSVEGRWSEKTINNMASRMILLDVDYFKPTAFMTRADFAIYMVRALGLDGTAVDGKFSDVELDTEVNRAITTLVKHDLIAGYPDGKFKAGQTITRQEMGVMVANAQKYLTFTGRDESRLNKTDIDLVSTWAKSFLDAVAYGILNGYEDDSLRPLDQITNEEGLQVISNMLNVAGMINE